MHRKAGHDNEGFRECARFHGHVCPGLAIGFRAATHLLWMLGTSRADDEELFAVAETDACGVDAIQVLTGCTAGKGNLLFMDYGKHAFTLGRRRGHQAFRASLRSTGHCLDEDFLRFFEKVRSGSATPGEKEEFRALRESTARQILEMDMERLFIIEPVVFEPPPKALILRSGICPRCGEPVRIDYLAYFEGVMACPSCRASLPKT